MAVTAINLNRPRSSLGRNYTILLSMVRRNIRLKYHSSVFGFAWSFLGPLLLMTLLIVVFTNVIRVPIKHYWAFLISGYFAWHYINATINYSANVMEEHSTLIRNFNFPYELAVIAGALSRLVDFLVEIIAVATILAVFHHHYIPPSFMLLPILVVLQIFMILGPMLLIATIAVFNEDMKHILPLLLTALFYATPVFYSVDLVPEYISWIYLLNPAAQLMKLYHYVLYQGVLPPLHIFLVLAVEVTVLSVVGFNTFNRYRGRFPDLA